MPDDAERFATRAWVVCGAFGGAVVGLFVAPRMQRSLRGFGVDPAGFAPAMAIILLAAILGGVLSWRAARR
jgi:hypothetical protein